MSSPEFPVSLAELERRARGELVPFGASRAEVIALRRWCHHQPPVEFGAPSAGLPAFVVFIGYPRSGHSLVGALLDAHDEVAISHEVHVIPLCRAGFTRHEILTLVLESARRFAAIGRIWGRYSYAVAGAAQGRWTTLRIAGDKRGGGTTKHLAERPQAIRELAQRLGLPVKVVHVVREPRRNIASMAVHYTNLSPAQALDRATDQYCWLASVNAACLGRMERGQALTIWHEDLIADPAGELAKLCRFLGLVATAPYLAACARIVSKPAGRASQGPAPSAPQARRLRQVMEDVPFLRRYLSTAPDLC